MRQHLVEVGLARDGEVGPKGGLGALSGVSLMGGRRRKEEQEEEEEEEEEGSGGCT